MILAAITSIRIAVKFPRPAATRTTVRFCAVPSSRAVEMVSGKCVEPYNDASTATGFKRSGVGFVLATTGVIKSVVLEKHEVRGTVVFRLTPRIVSPLSLSHKLSMVDLHKVQISVVVSSTINGVVVKHPEHIANCVDGIAIIVFGDRRPAGKNVVVYSQVWATAKRTCALDCNGRTY